MEMDCLCLIYENENVPFGLSILFWSVQSTLIYMYTFIANHFVKGL